MKLTRTDWKYLIDSLMFLCILGMVVIGFFLGLVIPRGTAAEGSKYLLGLHRHQWGDIHFYLSMAFITLLCVHLVQEWNWIKGKARQLFKRSWKAALMVTLLAAFLVPFLFWLLAAKDDPNYREQGRRDSRAGIGAATSSDFEPRLHGTATGSEDFEINGRMTLSEVEKTTGVPATDILFALGLPLNLPADETLGRLRMRAGITMQNIRDTVSDLRKKARTEK